ncbi:FMN-dependent NADH-azoreductase [Providencia sp. wls1943]|uniref:FMN-dependent NADH-azoreductase n=1 Tax=unclassified Providencia TaxID=2633465 RepID=UPI0012B5CF24|nr:MULTISPECIES: NAD(P)H-dependent oxidoreductase [unclassified Providencia]MTB67520.1 FMN-dependent NADH-azoreductase [Providencia sp. wls1943]
MKILVIKSSINGAQSQTNTLIQQYLDERKAQGYQDCVIERDVAENPLPVLNQARFAALRGAEISNPDLKNTAELSDQLIAELKESDLLLLGAPMYNLNVPTELKNWFDLVVRARETFRYTATYPLGLVENVKALVFSARGGIHYGQETDAITPYLNSVLGLMGINDVQFIYAEGLDMKPEGYEAGLAKAKQQLMLLIHN